LLTLTASGIPYSHLLQEAKQKINLEDHSYINVTKPKLTPNTPGPMSKTKLSTLTNTPDWSKFGYSSRLKTLANPFSKLTFSPLTPEAMHEMVIVRPKCEILGASYSGCNLLIKYHSDLFQVETSLLFDGHDGHVLIHVPMTPRNSLLRLFRIHSIPLPLFKLHHLVPDVKTDVLAISSTDTRYNIQLSSTDLLSCHGVSQIFMCDSFGVMSKRFDDTCRGALYMQKFEAAQNLCKFNVILVEEQVAVQRLICGLCVRAHHCQHQVQNGTHSKLHLRKGMQQVNISPGCQGFFSGHMVTSDYSVK